jgi:hypothetical protein
VTSELCVIQSFHSIPAIAIAKFDGDTLVVVLM